MRTLLALAFVATLAGSALAANRNCINGRCFTCEGSLSCSNGACTCNGAPIQADNDAKSAPADDTLVMTFINKSSSPTIYYAFYAEDRSMSWPGVGEDAKDGVGQPGVSKSYWVDRSGDRRIAYTIRCARGQTICWAAWHDGNLRDGRGGWGAGAYFSVACKGCCYKCGNKPETQRLD